MPVWVQSRELRQETLAGRPGDLLDRMVAAPEMRGVGSHYRLPLILCDLVRAHVEVIYHLHFMYRPLFDPAWWGRTLHDGTDRPRNGSPSQRLPRHAVTKASAKAAGGARTCQRHKVEETADRGGLAHGELVPADQPPPVVGLAWCRRERHAQGGGMYSKNGGRGRRERGLCRKDHAMRQVSVRQCVCVHVCVCVRMCMRPPAAWSGVKSHGLRRRATRHATLPCGPCHCTCRVALVQDAEAEGGRAHGRGADELLCGACSRTCLFASSAAKLVNFLQCTNTKRGTCRFYHERLQQLEPQLPRLQVCLPARMSHATHHTSCWGKRVCVARLA